MIYGISFNGDNSEYKFTYSDNKLEMCYSEHDSNWTEAIKGTICAVLKNTGDDVVIKLDNKEIKLDYAELEVMFLLLTYYTLETQTNKPSIFKMEKTFVY